jgi:hypothetical protein
MLRSRANTLLSVRRVTERNAGRLTAGVDGEVVLTPEAKARLADRVHQNTEPFKALPVGWVYIPKRGSRTKRRPLGIPVILDRCHQARVVNALEPEWEARFEPRSYGFRPGRGCHDAIQAIYEVVKGRRPRRLWALDADLAGAFDRVAHDHILTMLGTKEGAVPMGEECVAESAGNWAKANALVGSVVNGLQVFIVALEKDPDTQYRDYTAGPGHTTSMRQIAAILTSPTYLDAGGACGGNAQQVVTALRGLPPNG